MRILMLTSFLPPIIGGVERHAWTLARALATRGHDVTLLGFATGTQEPGESQVDGVRIVRVRTGASYLPFLYSDPDRPHPLPVADPLVHRAIRHELSCHHFDVIHAHNWIVNSALAPAASARVPVVMTLHDYSHRCVTARMMEQDRRPCPGPSTARCMACGSSHFGALLGPVTVLANAWSARQRSRRVAGTAAVSGAVAGVVNVDGERGLFGNVGLAAQVIPNFIPDEIICEDIPLPGHDAPLLFVGDLVPDKGIDVLLSAYGLLDGAPPLVLAGRSEAELSVRLPPGVTWLGALPHEQVLPLYASARAVIVPSVWSDPCPTVVLEAMAAGRPVVAAASGGILDMVVDGVTGVLVPPGDVAELARAIAFVSGDAQTARSFGVAGRDRVRRFAVSAVVAQIERMYVSAIDAYSRELDHAG
ncbi:glycogen(starch) synthase [Mycobacterium sp. MAA66]|uniref:glycosyltransferase family 4 protein n=1 Tax=Mycobacterium sp. MAA66 TaxID=3156297 RepID=UPI0035115765